MHNPMTTLKQQPYRAFLIRCWSDARTAGEQEWRFVVVHVADEAQPHGFATLDALVAFLKAELCLGAQASEDSLSPGGAAVREGKEDTHTVYIAVD